MGLKSLVEIKASKKTLVYKKRKTKTSKSGQTKSPNERSLEHLELKYQQKQILNQLKELTSLIKRIDKRIVKIEQKVAKEEGTE
jgi:hypothetical protein